MNTEGTTASMAVEGELTIYTAGELKPRFVELLAQAAQAEPKCASLDLSQVSEIDSAGLQLLMLARREAAARQIELALVGHSSAVIDCLNLCDLGTELGPVAVAASAA